MNFQDRKVQYPNRIKLIKISEEQNGDITYDLERVEGIISNPGTPLNAATLNLLVVKADVNDIVYPIGSVYINATYSTNPKILLGFGEWEQIGKGRMLMGVGSNGEYTHTLGEASGSETSVADHTHPMSHTHNLNSHTHDMRHSHQVGSTTGYGDSSVGMGLSDGTSRNGISACKTTTTARSYYRAPTGTNALNTSYNLISQPTNAYTDTDTDISGRPNTGVPSTNDTGTASISNTGNNNVTSKKNLPPYFTCYIWLRKA